MIVIKLLNIIGVLILILLISIMKKLKDMLFTNKGKVKE